MKRFTPLLAVGLLLGACAESPVAPPADDFAPAFGIVFNDAVPFAQINAVPCAGELVLLSGNLHVLITLTIDANGGVHTKAHFQPQGASGTGLTTGDTYRAVGVTQQTLNINSGGLPLTFTAVNNFRLIGPGTDNNLQVHQVTHVTINENGVVSSLVIQNNVTCT